MWDYRVMVRTWPTGEKTYGIHEVYYSKGGKVKGWTVEEMGPHGDTMAELRKDLARMRKALSAPVLKYKGWRPRP